MVLTRFPIGLLLAWFYNRRFELPIETSPKLGFLAVADNVQSTSSPFTSGLRFSEIPKSHLENHSIRSFRSIWPDIPTCVLFIF